MFNYLENHDFFITKKAFDNTKGYQEGFEKIKYTEYEFENNVAGDNLFLFIPEEMGEIQWIYHFPQSEFLQKINSHYSNVPSWINEIIQDVEEKFEKQNMYKLA